MHFKLIGATALTAGMMAFGALGLASPASASVHNFTPPGNSCQDQGWNHQQGWNQEDRNCFPGENNRCDLPTGWNSFRSVQPNDCFKPPIFCHTWNTWQDTSTWQGENSRYCPRPPVCHPQYIGMNEQHGTYYTGALVTPGERLVYNHVTYTVKTVTPVFHGIHTGQSIVTFFSTAGLPLTGDTFVNFTTGHSCFHFRF